MKKCFLGFPGYNIPAGYSEVTLLDIVYFKKLFLEIEEPEDIIITETTTEPITETITETVEPTTPNRPDFLTPEQIVELEKVEALNIDSIFFEVFYKKGSVSDIIGKFSEVSVTDAESALLSLYSIKALLGIDDLFEEFYLEEIIDNRTFRFVQVYNGVTVWSRNLSVMTIDGEILSMGTSYKNVSGTNTVPTLSKEEVLDLIGADTAELYIYSYDEYEDNPILIYDCQKILDNFGSETILVSAMDGNVISRWSNVIVG